MKILITGANGFLGRLISAELPGAIPLVRRPSGMPGEVYGDLTGRGLAAAMKDVEVVVHAAGGGMAKDPAKLYLVNHQGTACVIDAAKSAGVKRIVFISSIAAAGPSTDGTAIADDQVRAVSHYGKSKAAAEDVVRTSGLSWCILRPPSIYGPGDYRFTPLFAAARRGFVVVPKTRRVSLVYGEDAARLVAKMTASKEQGIHYADDGTVHSWPDVARSIGRAVGRKVRVVRLPNAALHVAARLGSRRLTRDKVRDALAENMVCDSSATRLAFSWEARVALDEGMSRTNYWLSNK